MPLYEYGCRSCGSAFEKMRSMQERLSAPSCPSCGGQETVLRLSAPGMVGTRSVDYAPACGTSDASACCGGGCALPSLN